MVLGFDIGNTNIRCGFYSGDAVPEAVFSNYTKEIQSEDDLYFQINVWLAEFGINNENIIPDGAIYSSVVPKLNIIFKKVLRERFGLQVLCVSSDISLDFYIHYENPAMLGADRITNAAAVFENFSGKDCIVVDIGTAVTFCVLLKERIFDGGIIAPGFGISADALASHTAQLFRTQIAPLQSAVGRSTQDGIQSGIFFGGVAMICGLINRIETEYGRDFTIILTGGGAEMAWPFIQKDALYDPLLTMKGLFVLYKNNIKNI